MSEAGYARTVLHSTVVPVTERTTYYRGFGPLEGHIAYRTQFAKMGIFRASSWAHSQGTFRVRALGSKPRFWSTAKELQGTICKSLVNQYGTGTNLEMLRY